MFWWILFGISCGTFVFLIIFGLLKRKNFDDTLFYSHVGALFPLVIMIVTFIFCLSILATYNRDINTFKQTKHYIEEVVPTLEDTDNYAITNTRIEMNKWLYDIQYRYEHYSFWNFIPSEVEDLEEIR